VKEITPQTRLRLLLVDDSAPFLTWAARTLERHPEVEIVGQARSGKEALEQVTQVQPDVVLLDMAMPDMNGVDVTRYLKGQPEAPYIVIVTLHDAPHYRTAAEAAGADNFISKADFGTEVGPLLNALLTR
jgi:DNA-binding NarL/FixJ family response regulator